MSSQRIAKQLYAGLLNNQVLIWYAAKLDYMVTAV